MQPKKLLEKIWQGKVSPARGYAAENLLRAFEGIVPVRTVPLVVSEGLDAPVAFSDETELEHGLPLGDVITQELDIQVDQGVMILLIPAADLRSEIPQNLSRTLGQCVAEAVVHCVTASSLPLQEQTNALYLARHAALTAVERSSFLRFGIDPQGYVAGVMLGFDSHWQAGAMVRGAHAPNAQLLSGTRLHAYLGELDASFRAPDLARAPRNLFACGTAPGALPNWMSRIEAIMQTALDIGGALAAPIAITRPI